MKPYVLPVAALMAALPAGAENLPSAPLPQPELSIRAAQPDTSDAQHQQARLENTAEKTILVDAAMLQQNPELLGRVMYSAVVAQNIAGIKAVLPVYEQWPQHDKEMAKYAKGLLAQGEGRNKEAISHYRDFIARNPDAPMARWQLATALYEDLQNEAAADQFERLQSEKLPDAVRARLADYRKALRERDSWKFSASASITREQNINQAPEQRRLGDILPAEECALVQSINSSDDCFRGWTFDAPLDATAFSYQVAAEKKWSLQGGRYLMTTADAYGKIYPNHSVYNDLNTRISAGGGYADGRDDAGIAPFHERRFYGNNPYSYSNGIRLHWNRWQTPKIQMLTAIEWSRLSNTVRQDADSQNRLFSASLVYYRSARQYWLAGADIYQEHNKRNNAESFKRYNLRASWGQEWRNGFSTRLHLNAARRHYDGESLFSNGSKRKDKEWGAAVSLWHRAVHFKGLTPRLTFVHNQTSSNDIFYEYGKSRMFIELGKTF